MIYNGIEVQPANSGGSASDAAARARLGIKDGPVVGIIARLSEVKGHVYLIRAMPKVLAQIPEARLVIVGEGKIKPDLVSLCERLGIIRSVYFISEIPDLPQALALMDVFVMPSLNEGLGLSLMEAMAAGREVIGSNVGGIPNLIRHEDTGILVEPSNEGQIAEAIVRLLGDKSQREQLGLRAREFILENFSARAMVEQTERVYLECLNA
jgi:glycosyltransferase involved in cell wall biosynthesis